MRAQVHIQVYGNVQGVGFRKSAKIRADENHLTGIVRNTDVGSVYIEVEGEEKDVDAFIEWCKVGPSNAQIDHVDVARVDETVQYGNFAIL